MLEIKSIAIIGANGTMGANVAGLLAAFADVKIYAVSRDLQKSQEAVKKAVESVKADAVVKNLEAKTYDDLAELLPTVDWVFESVSENMEIKTMVNSLINQYVSDDTIITTGTSGLSIEELSCHFRPELQKRYIGSHFFNPPYSLPLCEIIPTTKTDLQFLKEFKSYVEKNLFRHIVEVQDQAGFLANRIGFQFMNEIAQLAEVYKERGGIAYIDAILGQFSGRSMAPLQTIDFVGLDVHEAIVDNLLEKTTDYANHTFELPEYVRKLIKENLLGRKKGAGFYKRETLADGTKRQLYYDLVTQEYLPVPRYEFTFKQEMMELIANGEYEKAMQILKMDSSEEAQICLSLLIKYIIYSLYVSNEIAEKLSDADIAMASGFNWLPPLGMIEALGGVTEVRKLCSKHLPGTYVDQIDYQALLDLTVSSPYDYRRYLKAKY